MADANGNDIEEGLPAVDAAGLERIQGHVRGILTELVPARAELLDRPPVHRP